MNIALTARPQERERSARTTRPVDAGVAEDNRVIICGRARTVGRRLPSATWTAARALRRARTVARAAVHSATQALLPRSSIVDARRIESALPEEPRKTSPLQLLQPATVTVDDASRPALSSASPPRSAGDLTTRARDVSLQLGQCRPSWNTGDLIIRAQTAKLLWRVVHAARATQWAPEMEDCGAAAYDILDDAIDALDAHVRSGCA